ncbi:DUF5763 domain-containing protein [Pedobacter mendelii]|uniref:DUF5763 domain-containing protein n=1 Tax=Pedobacter mendelii TaxID=1908240 RepID=UPI00353120D1
MKTLLFLLIGSLLLFNAPTPKNYSFRKPVATCYGKSNCIACSNCSGCKHCNSGGSCGVCANAKSTTINTFSSRKTITTSNSYVGQCKAFTKKGARCKRSANGNGFCWQHGK